MILVGSFVGRAVGIADILGDGLYVIGIKDGFKVVGDEVGKYVGFVVGIKEGVILGIRLGDKDGETLGSIDGDCEGTLLGDEVGKYVGIVVGFILRLIVGGIDGFCVLGLLDKRKDGCEEEVAVGEIEG
jgi:hypothetical protein